MNLWNSLPEQTKDYLRAEQHQLEMLSIDKGIERYRELRTTKERTTLQPEQRIVVELMEKVIPAVEKRIASVLNGDPAPGVTRWGIPILSLPPEKLALIAIVCAVNASGSIDNTFTRLCLSIANAIKVEREFALLKKNAPDVYKTLTKHTKKWNTKSFSRLAARRHSADNTWDKNTKIWLGSVLVECLLETEHFEHVKVCMSNRTIGVVRLKESVERDLEQQHGECELLRPFLLPTVVPPQHWSDVNRYGGYLYHKTTIMKPNTDGANDSVEDFNLYNRLPSQLYTALNFIQDTPFIINEWILSIQEALWAEGGGTAGIPLAEKIPIPPVPAEIDFDEEIKMEWKRKAATIHRQNAEMVAQRKGFMNQMWIAKIMKKYPMFFFPVQLDWRTRVYPKPWALHPQECDSARALLLLAEGKALQNHGWEELQIYLANCIGMDKLNYSERIAAVTAMRAEILSWVVSPLANRGWTNTEEPWKCLAAAKEYANALAHPNGPAAYVCHLAGYKDGSCNGLQHLSAMGLDPIGALEVNLRPGKQPRSVYLKVASKGREIIARHIEDQPELPIPNWIEYATYWKDKLDKNTAKRGVMTTPYGVTDRGITMQFLSDGHVDRFERPFYAAEYLRLVVQEAISGTVVQAKKIMDWFQQLAEILAKNKQSISWPTPIDLVLTQHYTKSRTKRVVTLLQEVYLKEPTKELGINVVKQMHSISPNIIHSFDAAHLFLTANAALENGLTALVPIHDSYGTHFCDIRTLGKCLRQEFVAIYSINWLEEIYNHVVAESGLEIPKPPERGTFDISEVLESDYCFH